jgi:hypothetical protein
LCPLSYGDLVLPNTGEYLTKERFDELHNSSTPHTVLIFSNSQEVLDKVIPHPLVVIVSDGLPGHPRTPEPFRACRPNTCGKRGQSP